ncbi:hypothetical protein PROFUN_00494 [Planoprotostelium fungivorum]|uniref:Uncharacterized protein n=1 Tax=Planoprotostelium fungivorum TaxID=1890364 RepID=A0A2P6N115_9EUKA|nr:hypothetical protein PROFUN_00494 [Planoprotostelium fungivorum]
MEAINSKAVGSHPRNRRRQLFGLIPTNSKLLRISDEGAKRGKGHKRREIHRFLLDRSQCHHSRTHSMNRAHITKKIGDSLLCALGAELEYIVYEGPDETRNKRELYWV